MTGRAVLPRATARDTLGSLTGGVLPTVAKVASIRWLRVEALVERPDRDHRAVHRLQRPRDRYGDGPLLLPLPPRPQMLVLVPAHVRRVLDGTPSRSPLPSPRSGPPWRTSRPAGC